MEIEILARKSSRKSVIEASAQFYAKKLNILKSKYKVFICMDPDLAKDSEANGMCAKTGDKEITIALYSRLNASKLFVTLAHEMVHAKQMMRGQYRIEICKRGKTTHYWMGKPVKKEYIERPWEIEAMSRESILVEALNAHLIKLHKKGNART